MERFLRGYEKEREAAENTGRKEERSSCIREEEIGMKKIKN